MSARPDATAEGLALAKPWLTFVGIGEDGLDGLSHAARQALAQARLVVGGRRHLALAAPLTSETLTWASPIEDTYPAIFGTRPRPVCVLASGDPFCFGVGSVLARHLPAEEFACFPQPSAFSLASARLGWAQQDCVLLSLCGRPIETLLPALQPGQRVLALSADGTTPQTVASFLTARGFDDSLITICEAMGGPRERLRRVKARDRPPDDVDALNTLAIEVVADRSARVLPLAAGLPDAWFEHDGQITKSDTRAVTLAKLAPRCGEVLWDIGAGSGSIAIEWMLADAANRAVAVERQPERVARIRRNAVALGVPALDVVEGSAPEVCAALARPDAIFIGGGATGPEVVETAMAALGPGGRLVINAVTLETQALLTHLFSKHGGSLTSLQIAQADKIGGFHGWRAAMLVVQWLWVRPFRIDP